MSEKFANINVGHESFPATRENTIVYNHHGKGALYDHVFVEFRAYGAYVWAQIPPDNPLYTQLAATAIQHGAETHLNIREVHKQDIAAFGKAALLDIDERPEWLP